MKKIKPLLPSLREKKRYVAFRIHSKTPVHDRSAVSKAIHASSHTFLGTLGCAKAGIIHIEDQYQHMQGIVRVNNQFVPHVRAALTLITSIDGNSVIVQSLGTSGILKKAQKHFAA